MGPKALTIRDIARLAGVSHSTVSLVLNNNHRISTETRQRVVEVMERVGYAPNVMARSLVRRSADMLGVILPRTSEHTFADWYFAEAISGIAEATAEKPMRLLLEFSSERFVRERAYLTLFRQRQIDGMLVLGSLTTDTFVREVHDAGFPVCLVNSEQPGVPCVVADNARGVHEALDHLVALGHRRIAHLGGLTVTTVGRQRFEAFQEGMRGHGLDPEAYLAWGDFSEASGYRAMRELVEHRPRPTAVLAGNDLMAFGALRCLESLGVRVPEQMSVVGADDVRPCPWAQPPLTTIRQPIHGIGQRAAAQLLARIHGHDVPAREVVPTELVVRASTAPPPHS